MPDSREIGFAYDPAGNLTSLTPPGRPSHEFDYTAVNLLNSYDPPILSDVHNVTTQYAYNLNREIDFITRPDGQVIDYVYNEAGKLSTINLPGSEQIIYTYNETTGKPATLTSPDGQTLTYTYDGSLTTSISMSGLVSGTVSRTYDNNFRVTSRVINGTDEVSFTYDNDGLLKTAGDLNILLNPATGLPDGTILGQTTTSNTYTLFGELQSETYTASGTPIYQVIYERDTLGRIVERTETIEGTSTAYTYTYDLSGSLIEVYQNGDADPTSRYDYDTNGNRISFSDYRSGTMTVNNGEYDNQDRMTSYGNATKGHAQYEYTANGELLTKTLNEETTTYNYDVLGNLREVTLPDGTEINYIIDGQNRRVGKKVNGTLEQGLLYKDELNPIAELDGDGQVVSTFVYGSKFNVPAYIKSNKADKETWVTYRIISDHLGSPRLVVNAATGEIVQRMDFDEFGRVMQDTNPGFQPFGYAGGIYDGDTGLVRFGARDYDAETGRWTSKDPIGFGGGDANLYGYVMSDPVNFIDSEGYDRYISRFEPWDPSRIHVGVAVDRWSKNVSGNWVKTGVTRFDFSIDWNAGAMNIIAGLVYGKGMVTITHGSNVPNPIRQKSTPEEDIRMYNEVMKDVLNPPGYNGFLYNCIHWAADAYGYGLCSEKSICE